MDRSKTTPSGATRAEEDRDAQVKAGPDTNADSRDDDRAPADLDPEVAENYEEAIERGADQRGEGRLP
jgi:ribosome-binding protein aMBF1 (putative translation factor)